MSRQAENFGARPQAARAARRWLPSFAFDLRSAQNGQAAQRSPEFTIDRIVADMTADAHGDVVVHIGEPGTRVHVVVELAEGVATPPPSRLMQLCGIWADFDIELPDRGPPREVEAL